MLPRSSGMLLDCELMGLARRIELRVPNVEQAWSFYRDIMGAREVFRIPGDAVAASRIGLTIGKVGFVIMPENDAETGDNRPSLALLAEEFGATFAAIVLYVQDPAAVVRRALGAGSELQPGAPSGTPTYRDYPVEVIVDPFGHFWAFAMSPEEHPR
jgi:uncharacterized glyoxalase superfamily protein PhnB